MYQHVVKPLLFRLDAEQAHHLVFGGLGMAGGVPGVQAALRSQFSYRHPSLEREVFGLKFRNPIGLAAGFDKDARLVDELAALGFGHVEIGTVTPRPQPGNPTPRLFRLPTDRALINRMGFNNGGAAAAAERLRKRSADIIIGGNIGKNKDTPNDTAAADYVACVEALHDVVDYFVVNVSSPNTPGLRQLQEREPLLALLRTVQRTNQAQRTARPLLLKIAPDLSNEQLDDIIGIVQEAGLSGVVATNTTIDRTGLQTPAGIVEQLGAGGLSGAPLRNRATEVIRYLHTQSGGAFPIIGVGGIFSPADVQEKLAAGASLVQLYTGFIYEGPGVVQRMCRELVAAGRVKQG
ncbi:quinone-dependent dihydroorotate dehydrogenase [Hymenobacter busanensis]|uniref:Dihydroorotate dehydrogenase (quinone) n=1 Tax=Hymenobacter busanensis TaxID=2607656 RepID=A0A7L5A316_9BACT|nr:quinone-dependent dihydroorotate dehydrogenase [Hymenobacter busanensis]KAA9331705.1 quinone-dependent dihydroorotate dehydrogenase [Hymenobacter busanensis]QHJ09737.1 quinone-dependent dihydroorotate dehydrogenase [Hymenobacter busanensis]